MRSFFNLALSFCGLLLLTTSSVAAEQLQFQTGQSASYIVTQTIELEALQGCATTATVNDTIAFDVKIISIDPLTQSYPIDVEVTLRRLSCESTLYRHNAFNKPRIITYDSNSLPISGNAKLAKKIASIIDLPLKFTVNKDFDIKELTCVLSKFEKSLNVEVHGFLATPVWNMNVLLTQLFHLAGENLEASQTYPVNSWKILLGDAGQNNISLSNNNESSGYTIDSIDSDRISATWKTNLVTEYVELDSSSWTDDSSSWSNDSSSWAGGFNWTDSSNLFYSSDDTSSSYYSSDLSEVSNSSGYWSSSGDWIDYSSSSYSTSDQILPIKTSLTILSNIIWDKNNPLKQNRYFNAHLKEFRQTSNNPLSLFQCIIQQKWEEVSP